MERELLLKQIQQKLSKTKSKQWVHRYTYKCIDIYGGIKQIYKWLFWQYPKLKLKALIKKENNNNAIQKMWSSPYKIKPFIPLWTFFIDEINF